MLTLTILGQEYFDTDKQEFVYPESVVLELEHSLVSLSKWEQIWEKPFLAPGEKTTEEVYSYIKCMCLNDDVTDEQLKFLSAENMTQINEHLDAKMTATTFHEIPGQPNSRGREQVTNELIYYWMVSFKIPFETQYWHLNRLITLIKVLNAKNQPAKKMGRREQMSQQRQLNAQRRAQMGTSG